MRVALVMEETFDKDVGASGLVSSMPPLPGSDASEEPTTFVAKTFTKTLAPQGKFKGADYSTWIGMVQVIAAIIAASAPLQLVS